MFVRPNKAILNGETKIIAGFGSKQDGFFVKSELIEIAQRAGLNLSDELTRGKIASALLCQFQPEEESNQKASLELLLETWFTKKNKENKKDQYRFKQWTPFARNSEHESWFSRNVKTFEDFANYTYGVVTKYLPSPFYDFQSNDKMLEEKTQIMEKSLFSNNKKAMNYLVNINKTLRFITVYSKTLSNNFKTELCKTTSTTAFKDSVYVNRAFVVGIMHKDESHLLAAEMNKRNFIALCLPIGHKHNLSHHCDKFGFKMHSKDVLAHRAFNDELKQVLTKNCEYVFVMDFSNHRAAEEKDGLFQTLLCVLENNCQLDDGDDRE